MIFIAGATGFIGGNLMDDLLSKRHKVKCLVRSAEAEKTGSSKGFEVVRGDITMPETLKDVLRSDDFVIHLVGIIAERGKATFKSIHVEGTANLVEEAKRARVKHFFYQSALGADKNSWSDYLRTKAEAEEIVKQSGLRYTIFRPSLIIGPWDGFTSRLMKMIKLFPILPIPGEGRSRFQPVYIRDWMRCMSKVIDSPEKYPSTYDIGGPEHLTYTEMVEILSEVMGRKNPLFRIPMGLMKLLVSLLSKVFSSPPVTSDQLRLLEMDNISDLETVERNFGFKPVRYKDALKDFIK